jgi:putative ABC transport system permease protein
MNLFYNYLKVAARNIIRQRIHAAINIFGLSTGLAFALFIYAFVLHELSFDTFHRKKDQLYFFPMTWHFNGTSLPAGANCSVAGPFIKDAFPEVETYVRVSVKSLSFRKDNEVIKETDVYYADSSFFNVFTFPMLKGDVNRSLSDPYSVVLTRTSAIKYFGLDWETKNILGMTLETNNNKTYTITGVVEDVPVNSHLKFTFLVSLSSLPGSRTLLKTWDNSEFYTYVVLHPRADAAKLISSFPAKLDEHFGKGTNETIELDLIPLRDVYLHSPRYKAPNTSNVIYVKVFSLIAILILVIATVNYINLATARAIERAPEVGVRKVLGSMRSQLFTQFLSESLILTTFSFFLAIGIASLFMPYFSRMIDRPLDIGIVLNGYTVSVIFLAGLIIGFLAGVYPAMFLSGYEPVKVLKGRLKDSAAGLRLRKGLVIGQFLISITLIICTLTVSDQIRFIQSKESGFNREQLVSLSLDSLARTRIGFLKTNLVRETQISGAAATYQLPLNLTWQTALGLKGGKEEDRMLMNMVGVDSDFVKTIGLTIVAGADLKPDIQNTSETWEILLNESAAAAFGWSSEAAVGKELQVWGSNGVIKGVVKDFHFSSLHAPIAPLVIMAGQWARNYSHLLVNIAGSPDEIRETLEAHWKTAVSDSPFLLTFLNDQYEDLYKKEKQLGLIVNVFAFLAIFISVLGLFGLASYSIVQRTRELGVRKVLGASPYNLTRLVSAAFMRPVGIAFLVAAPLSWYVMNGWLKEFAYHTSFSWLTVFLSGIISLALVMLTIFYHLFTVSRLNPAETLRAQ